MKSLVTFLFLLFFTFSYAQEADLFHVIEPYQSPDYVLVPGSVLEEWPTINNLVLGIAAVNDTIYITSGGSSSTSTTDNKWYRYSMNGTMIDSFPQAGSTQGWGYRDLAFDGTYLLGSESGVIHKVNRWTFTDASTISNSGNSPHRGLAYNPDDNSVWSTNFTTGPLLKMNAATGATIRNYGPPSVAPYGIALDRWSRAPIMDLWYSEPSVTGGPIKITRVDTATGLVNISYDVTASAGTGPSSGGLEIINNHPTYPGKVVALALIQGSRKVLVVEIGSVVPVELTSFTGTAVDKTVHLNWSTATETNNKGFEVQKKIGNEYMAVGFLTGNGSSTKENKYSFVDSDVQFGEQSYRLKQVDFNGRYEYSKIVTVDVTAPNQFTLEQNYPNPFNPTTNIQFNVPNSGMVKLAVYNMLGQQVQSLVNEFREAGMYQITFDASTLSSGTYFYKLETQGFSKTMKMTLAK